MARYFSQRLAITSLAFILTACDERLETSQTAPPTVLAHTLPALQAIGRISTEKIQKTEIQVIELRKRIESFLAEPTDENLILAQQAWNQTHQSYVAAKFGLLPPDGRRLDYLIDAWPMQPGFLDTLPEYPASGVIGDSSIEITIDNLRQQHGITDDSEVSLGFHALEYLLFSRPIADFTALEKDPENKINRRRLALSLITQALEEDIKTTAALVPKQYASLDESTSNQLLAQFVTGTLHRLQTAFQESNLMTAQDQGHSTFSQTSLATLGAELKTLQQLTLSEVPLRPVLEQIDGQSLKNYEKTLADAIAVTIDPDSTEISRAKLPLMLSALLHQWQGFERLLMVKTQRE